MDIEYKTVGVTGVIDTSLKDGPGVVTAIVSVTGIEDNVNDIIEPGAYAESLADITPKGAWHHDWTTPVSKTLLSKELMPGDPMLPDKLPNDEPWPAEAGALMIKMQFNLDTQRGREAHSDVLFFGDQQEWSIGYKVPEGGARHVKNAVGGTTRRISKLRCYEYSPVLFGAMPAARTASVKDAQLSFKSLMGVDLAGFTNEIVEAEALLAEGGEEKRHVLSLGTRVRNRLYRAAGKVQKGRHIMGARRGMLRGSGYKDEPVEIEYTDEMFDEALQEIEASLEDDADVKGLIGAIRRRLGAKRRARAMGMARPRATFPVASPSKRSRYYKSADEDEYDDEDMDDLDLEGYEDDDEDDDDLMDFDPDDMDDEEKAALEAMGVTPQDLRQAISVMTKVANFLTERKDDTATIDDADAALIELEALDFDSTADAVEAIDGLTEEQASALLDLAHDFDSATDDETREALLDALADELDSPTAEADEAIYDGLRVVARVAGDLSEVADGEKSSRMFGPEYKTLARLSDRGARQRAYLAELKAQRPDLLDTLLSSYEEGSGIHSMLTEVKANGQATTETKDISPAADRGSFVIDMTELAALNDLTQ